MTPRCVVIGDLFDCWRSGVNSHLQCYNDLFGVVVTHYGTSPGNNKSPIDIGRRIKKFIYRNPTTGSNRHSYS
jgi:hypothetical protein